MLIFHKCLAKCNGLRLQCLMESSDVSANCQDHLRDSLPNTIADPKRESFPPLAALQAQPKLNAALKRQVAL